MTATRIVGLLIVFVGAAALDRAHETGHGWAVAIATIVIGLFVVAS